MHYLSCLLCAHIGDSHPQSALALQTDEEEEGSFFFVLKGRGSPARQGSQVHFHARCAQSSKAQDLFLQDDPNFNIFTETRDLVPSYSRPIGTVGLGLPGPQVLWLSLPFFPTEHQTLM